MNLKKLSAFAVGTGIALVGAVGIVSSLALALEGHWLWLVGLVPSFPMLIDGVLIVAFALINDRR